MNVRSLQLVTLVTIALAFPFTAGAGTELLYDFETGTEGWVAEWGLEEAPATAQSRARSGNQSLFLKHHFKEGADNIAIRILFEAPEDYTSKPGFAGFSAWIYFPSGHGWQAQMYTHTGTDWKWCAGKLEENLQPGWHQIMMKTDEIKNPQEVRDIGIQIKNFSLNYKAKIYIDRVEALYANGN